MKILKALQRKRQETNNVVPFERKPQSNYVFEKAFPEDLKIGVPSSPAFTEELSSATFEKVAKVETPEFATLEIDTSLVEPKLVAIKSPTSSYCEEYRTLRTHILHRSQRQYLKVVTLTSINPNEGKSLTAINLAWLLAQTDGVSALLIDGDLRKPSLARYLGLQADKGLSELIAGEAELEEVVVKLEPSGLHLIAGGAVKSDSSELLSGPKFREVLARLKQMFDYILIDAPPLAIFADSSILINQSDGAILVLRAGSTKYSTATRILENLPREKMLGVVLNDSEDFLEEDYYLTYEESAKP